MGYHGTVMPAVIKRNVLENPAWYPAGYAARGSAGPCAWPARRGRLRTRR
ncbi:MAG: hypothetical protein P8126_12665 [Gammaproteobacteria bacterium]